MNCFMLYFIFYQVFSENQLWLVAVFFKVVVFVDLMPNVIAIGAMIATVMKKIQSPARTYGL